MYTKISHTTDSKNQEIKRGDIVNITAPSFPGDNSVGIDGVIVDILHYYDRRPDCVNNKDEEWTTEYDEVRIKEKNGNKRRVKRHHLEKVDTGKFAYVTICNYIMMNNKQSRKTIKKNLLQLDKTLSSEEVSKCIDFLLYEYVIRVVKATWKGINYTRFEVNAREMYSFFKNKQK